MALGLLGIGFGAVHWAKTLMPDEEVVEERHPLRATDESRDRVVEVLSGGRRQLADHPPPADQVHPRRRARPVRRAARAAGGRLARPDAAEQPVADLLERRPQRPRPGPHLHAAAPHARPREHPDQGRGRHHRLGLPRHAARACCPTRSPATVAPRTSSRRRPRRPSSSCASTRGHHRVPEAARLGLPRHRRLLQDLHPRRLPGRPVRAADAPPALPVPPVDLRRDAGLRRSSSARPSGRCRSCRSPSTTRATSSPPPRSRKPSARASGSVAG